MGIAAAGRSGLAEGVVEHRIAGRVGEVAQHDGVGLGQFRRAGLENAQYPAAMTAASAAAVPAHSARFDRRGGGAATPEMAAAF